MAEVVAGAELEVVPTARGFGAKLSRQVSPDLRRAGALSGKQFGESFHRGLKGAIRIGGGTLGIGGALGLASLVKDSVQTEAAFSQRMAQIKANVQGATDASIANLSKLAIKLGNDTVFSANDAADAMLEMAKGGFTQAQIAGGGVQATMNLAAAEGMSLANAATIVSNNMNAYSIRADHATRITDALAAGSAASTASVTSLADGLSNVGGVARTFGFNINDTVGVLAAFDQNALRGAEGGTALRSLLTHLAAPTTKATDLMDSLGISLADRHGNFRDITDIAGQFQKKLGGLNETERAYATKTIAGAYGQRALNVLIKEGAKGLDKYIKSTEVQGKAQDLANARMSGTAGALERLHGAVETAELAIGKALAPTIVKLANFLGNKAAPAVTRFIQDMERGTGAGGEFADGLKDVAHTLGAIGTASAPLAKQVGHTLHALAGDAKTVADAFNSLPKGVKDTVLTGGAIALGAKKLGLIGGGRGSAGGLLGGVANKGAVPVYVTNLGPGGLGAGAAAAGASGGAGGAAAAAEAGGFLASLKGLLTGKAAGNVAAKGLGLGRLGSAAVGGFTIGDAGNEVKGPKSDAELRAMLAVTANKKAADASKAATKAAQDQATAQADLNTLLRAGQTVLPSYAKALLALPSAVRTQVTTPGAIQSIADVEQLKKRYDLTPKQFRLLMSVANLPNTLHDVNSIGAAADHASRPRQLKITPSVGPLRVPSFLDTIPKKRAAGGPVSAGQPYIVGERRPELFIPPQSGRIVPRVTATPAPAAASAPVSLAGQRLALHINGRLIEGVLEEIADGRISSAAAMQGQIDRAFG